MSAFEKVSCDDPVLIVSPTVKQDYLRSTHYCLNGVSHYIHPHDKQKVLAGESTPSHLMKLPYIGGLTPSIRAALPVADYYERKLNLENYIDNSFLYNAKDGETFPLYVLVPCGHCDQCNSRKLSSYIQRCQFAHEEAFGSSYFFTLTYNPEHCPKDGVSVRDVQLFKKKLKRTLQLWLDEREEIELRQDAKFNGVTDVERYVTENFQGKGSEAAAKLKFLITSEYTPKSGLPHYHGVCFGFPRLDREDPRADFLRTKMFQYAWRDPERDLSSNLTKYVSFNDYCKKYPRMRCIPKGYDPYSKGYLNMKDETCGDGPIRYILKYAFKMQFGDDNHVPEGKNELFKSVSSNLGLQWLKEHATQIDQDGKLRYCSVSDLTLRECDLSGYYISKLFPSVSKLIPSDVRKSYLDICCFNATLDRYDLNNGIKASCLASQIYLENKFPWLALFKPEMVSEARLRNKLLVNPIDMPYWNYEEEIHNMWCQNYVNDVKDLLLQFAKDVDTVMNCNVDYEDVKLKLLQRARFLNSIKPRSDSQKHEVGLKFRRDIAVARSKERAYLST